MLRSYIPTYYETRGGLPALHEFPGLHDVVLDGAVRPTPVAAQATRRRRSPRIARPAAVLDHRPPRDVDVGRIEHDRVLGHDPLTGDDPLAFRSASTRSRMAPASIGASLGNPIST